MDISKLMQLSSTKVETIEEMEAELRKAASHPKNNLPEPTDEQKKSGNYRKAHINIGTMDIAIENPAGSIRSGTDKDGNEWKSTIYHHYGYIKGTVGKDKDHLDVFIRPWTPTSFILERPVYVVDQVIDNKFDEHKVMLGFNSEMEAKDAYLANYDAGWPGLGAITKMTMDQFLKWVYNEKLTKKPVSWGKSVSADGLKAGTESFVPEYQEIPPEPEEIGTDIHDPAEGTDPLTPKDNTVETAIPYPQELASYRAIRLYEVTTPVMEGVQDIPYCPVYISTDDNGNRFIRVYITGKIEDLDKYLDLIDSLNTMRPNDLMHIYISSPGGYVSTGATIASCIAACKGQVVTIARGDCASAGSLIWSAGHICIACPMATFMYHMSSHIDMGNSLAIRNRANDSVRYVIETLLVPALNKKHITQEELHELTENQKEINISGIEMQQRLLAA